MHRIVVRGAVLVAGLLLLAGCGGKEDGPKGRVRLATTTSTDNSGLLPWVLEPFEKREGIEVQVVAVGTGQALALGERGDADLVLVHARELEDAFMAAGHGTERRDIMWNDFVLLGPPADPARIRGMKDAAHALRRIADAKCRFVSRGDKSGTHVKELSLWEKSGGGPGGQDWYLDAGQGMGRCLVMADEMRAYLLADRGTFLSFRRKVDLAVLVEGDPALHNPYGAILVDPRKHTGIHAEEARKLLDWFTSPEGQRRIGQFRVEGEILFHPADGVD